MQRDILAVRGSYGRKGGRKDIVNFSHFILKLFPFNPAVRHCKYRVFIIIENIGNHIHSTHFYINHQLAIFKKCSDKSACVSHPPTHAVSEIFKGFQVVINTKKDLKSSKRVLISTSLCPSLFQRVILESTAFITTSTL